MRARSRDALPVSFGVAVLSLLTVALLGGCGGGGAQPRKLQAASVQRRFASDEAANSVHAVSAHAAGTLVASLDFDPMRDGFSFENYGFIAGTEIDQHVMRELFGDAVCADAPSDSCTLTPAAQQWAQQSVDLSLGGHCFGFSVTALRLFTHKLSAGQFGGSTAFTLSLTPTLESELAYGFSMQLLDSVQRSIQAGPPSAVVAFLKKALANPSAEVYTLAFRNGNGPNSEGHAVTPIGIDDLGGGQYNILVYDNNHPGVTRAIPVDTSAETWSYQLASKPTDPTSLWSGQGTTNPLEVVPLSAGLGRQPCPFCGSSNGAASVGGVVRISLGGNPITHAHLLITTSRGHRLGYINGRFVNEIKGARLIAPLLNEVWKAHPEPIYELPAADRLDVTLDGTGAGGNDATVRVTGPGFGAAIANIRPTAGSRDQIELGPGASTLSLRIAGSPVAGSPTLQLARDLGRRGSELTVTPQALGNGARLTLALDPSINELSVASSGAGSSAPVALTLRRVGPNGSRSIHRDRVKLSSGGRTRFSLALAPTG